MQQKVMRGTRAGAVAGVTIAGISVAASLELETAEPLRKTELTAAYGGFICASSMSVMPSDQISISES